MSEAARDRSIVEALLAWYRAHARDLPWRRTRDPYAVWISEIMLQQTRVETVVPYFERFMVRYPDVGALAAAPLDDVLALWSGLGYYRRARELHAAAREVTTRYEGSLPASAGELRALRGIGAYTAGAIASIAFGRAEPLVDGNVARVLARLEAIADDPASTTGRRKLWAAAQRLVPARDPGGFNQALMELGATVCTPREPRCGGCPVRDACTARTAGRVAELPVVRAKQKTPVERVVAAVVRSRGAVLLAQRAAEGLFGGLWEPPMVSADERRVAARAASRGGDATLIARAREPLGCVGVPREAALAPGGRVRHALTHKKLEVLVAVGDLERRSPPSAPSGPYERTAWRDPADPSVALSTLARKVIARAAAQ